MSNPNVINLVGWPGTGKSLQCSNLVDRLGYHLWRPSDAIREFAVDSGITLSSRWDYAKTHDVMVEEDPDAFIRPVVELLDKDVDRVCVDGMRVVSNVNKLREACGMVTAALIASPKTSYERIEDDVQRDDGRKPSTFQAFIASNGAEAGQAVTSTLSILKLS